MKAEQILQIIQERLDGAQSQERLEEQNFINAQVNNDEIAEKRAHIGITTNRAQAGILQAVLDEIREADEEEG